MANIENSTPLETQDTLQKPSRFPLVVGVVIALLIVAAVSTYTWYYLYSPCGVNHVKAASTALIDQANAYDQAFQLAASASGPSLTGPVMQMQQVLMDTREVAVPACLQPAKLELLTAMEDTIRAFLAFMAQEPEATVTDLVEQSTTHLDNFSVELDAVNQCAPLCRRNP